VLRRAGVPAAQRTARASKADPYVPFILQTLERYPTLTASRLYAMVRERGYRGSPDHFRHIVAMHRPRRAAEAYLRLTSLPGEIGQVDWGHFGHLQMGRARRALMAFVMVLSWSRQVFVKFFLDARMESFLRGHIAAFQAWNGLPRILLYDKVLCGAPHKRFYVEHSVMCSSPPAIACRRGSGAQVTPHNGHPFSCGYIESSH
jgi:transposase